MGSDRVPSFAEEERFRRQGYCRVAGIDEVGRGALAGPVVAAAVILPVGLQAPWKDRVKDSKVLSPAQRASLIEMIRAKAVAVGIGAVDCWGIESLGISRATQLAMTQAVRQLTPPADALLIDYVTLPDVKLPQKGIVDGDALCFSIACASIVAKVTRDRLMADFDAIYPGYSFAVHKGYGTRQHLDCLRRLGPSPIHRRTFRPVRDITGG